jgi:hypothetical protein
MEIVGALEINGPPTEADIDKIVGFGKALASKIKSENMP